MKTFKLLSAIAAFAAVQLMTSCLKGDNDYVQTFTFKDMFNAVVSNQDGSVTLYPSAGYKVDWGYGDNKADVQISGLRLPDQGAFTTVELNDVPWKVNNKGWLDINIQDYNPSVTSGLANDLHFNNFHLQAVSRFIAGYEFPTLVGIEYTVNNKYQVYALPTELIELGNMSVVDPEGKVYSQSMSNKTIYYIELDPVTHKGDFIIQGAKFAEQMPAMNLKFPSIPFDVTPVGNMVMSVDELIPAMLADGDKVTSAGTPNPGFPITNFRAVYVPTTGLNVSFICSVKGQPYNVNISCKYETSSEGTQNQ